MTTIQDYALNGGSALALCVLLFLLYRIVRRRIKLLNSSPIAIHLLIVLLPVTLFCSDALAQLNARIPDVLLACSIFMGIHLAIRLGDVWLFDVLLAHRKNGGIPQVLRDICRWLFSTVALLIIVRTLFPEVNLNVLAVSSIVVGYILGNATQDTLGNLVSGLALNTESPFVIGDWVTIGGNTGRIVDMTWRATRLQTKTGDYVTIPNATIAREMIMNFSQPTTVHACVVEVGVNYGVPPAKVRQTLIEAALSVPAVLRSPAPKMRLGCYNDFSIDYRLVFYIDDFELKEELSTQVMERIWYYFKRNDISIPFPIRDVNMRQITPADDKAREDALLKTRSGSLDRIELFRPLAPDVRRQLATALVERVYGPGELILEQGMAGSLFFILESGRVDVSVIQGDRRISVATLGEGDVFGEMSFLTGEKTNASIRAMDDCVVLTLSHTELAGLLASNSRLADDFAVVLENRQTAGNARLTQSGNDKSAEKTGGGAASSSAIGVRIRRFFGLPSV